MAKVSAIIPSRNERFLQQTVEDLLRHATGDFECVVCLDGYWPDPPLPYDKRLKIVHFSEARGMRAAINAAAQVARGEYLMKCDAHTSWQEGFDEVLTSEIEDNWIVIPRRDRLDPEIWGKNPDEKRPPIDYEFLSCPITNEQGYQFHGTQWPERARERSGSEYELDDNMSFQGSAWMMSRKQWDRIGGMNEALFGRYAQEPQELGIKTWLMGGRIVTNRRTTYLHLFKGKQYGRGYQMNGSDNKRDHEISAHYFMNNENKWPGKVRDIDWLIDKFSPVPRWPEDWREHRFENLHTNGATNGHTPTPLPVKEVTPVSVIPVPPMNTLPFLCTRFSVTPDNKQVDLPISRADLALLFADLGFTRGVEIGVERGLYSEVLCQSIPGLQLSSIDMWQTYPAYREHVHQDKLDRFYAEAQTRLAPYNTQLIKAFSVDASREFEDGSLDFVYIDAAHDFLNVTQDLYHWSRKVRVGGIIAGHDFKREKNDRYTNHVKDVVQAWAYSHSIRPLFIVRGDHSPSWFWVREK